MIKNIIFDYGGVLLDWNPHYLYGPYFGDKEKAEWFINNVITEEWMRRLDIGEDFQLCVREQQAQYPDYAEAIGMYDTHYQEMIPGEIEGMRELLCRFKDGGSRLYGLSNWSYKVYEAIRKYPIFSLLDGMVISSDVHLLKPDSRIYQCLMEKYGLQNEDCVFIDDRKDNVEAAQKLKMQGIVFEDALQLRLKL